MAELWYLILFHCVLPSGRMLKSLFIMVYRAKITQIQSYIDTIYSLNVYNRVHDCQDVYIEVPTEEEAEQIELINQTQVKLFLQKMRLEDLRSVHNP